MATPTVNNVAGRSNSAASARLSCRNGSNSGGTSTQQGEFRLLVLQRLFLWQGDFREQFEPDNEMR